MDIKINKNDLNQAIIGENEILEKITAGQAILFTGAGFSLESTSISGKPPLAKELAKKICEIGEFDYDDDLGFVADFFINEKGPARIIEILKEEFTLKEVSQNQKDICSINWLSFYTTNYDRSIEESCKYSSKVIQSIDLDFPAKKANKGMINCLHINGDIDTLNEEKLEKGFKLTESSYVEPDSFVNSLWYKKFKSDLGRSSAIVFVGYSLFDFKIKQLLIESDDIKEKTYFIVAKDSKEKEKFTLSKYGKIVPIGVEGFAQLINGNKDFFDNNLNNHQFNFIHLCSIADVEEDIDDKKIEDFLMYGNIKKHFIDNAITKGQIVPYLIDRKQIMEKVYSFVREGLNVMILSGFGNGKTILLRQLIPYLLTKGIVLYEIADHEGDYISDIGILSTHKKKYIIVIDDYAQYLDLIEHCQNFNINNINFILSSRVSEHDTYKDKLHASEFTYQEIFIDELSNNEISDFISIINNLAWGGTINNASIKTKEGFIKNKGKKQLSFSLLHLYDSPHIKEKIKDLLEDLLFDSESKDTIFAILLINIASIKASFSTISDIAGNDHIYSSKLVQKTNFKQLFFRNNLNVESMSSVFCSYLIKNYFSAQYISLQLLKIAKNLDMAQEQRNFKEEKIFKSTLKFHFVERIFPDFNKKSVLKSYYENLKKKVTWLQRDPHFWLQYGMSHITYGDYPKAQQYLTEAYTLAKNKNNYHTKNIDNQQARLFIQLALEEKVANESYILFTKADKLLSTADNDKYKFNLVLSYKKYFLLPKTNTLSEINKKNFLICCKHMLSDIETSETSQDRRFQVIESLESIINNPNFHQQSAN
ncbi:MAG: hypothetical protein FE834_09255 [Gammaproteobacteria bacterium]|nr:hypothetical protein [Gammaproteobacteria bacterium]